MNIWHKVDLFLKYLKGERFYSEHTIDAYAFDLNQFFSYLIDQFPPKKDFSCEAISIDQLRIYLAFLVKRDYSLKTIQRRLSSLRSFFSFLDCQVLTQISARRCSVTL